MIVYDYTILLYLMDNNDRYDVSYFISLKGYSRDHKQRRGGQSTKQR